MTYKKVTTDADGYKNEEYLIGKIVTHSIIGLLLLITFFSSFTIIGAGKRGVVLRMGAVSDRILDEGLSFKMPWIESVKKIDVTTQKETVEGVDAASKDLQNVTANIAINYEINPDKANDIYQTFKGNHSERVIAPSIEEFVKKTTAQYTAEELITKRAEVKDDLKKGLTANLSESFITVKDVYITNFQFSAQFDKAVEGKVTAEQEALKAKNELERVKMEAEQRIAQAQAEAQAIRLQSDAANNPNYIKLKQIEAEVKAIEKWNGQLPNQFIPGSAIPFLNLTK